MQENVVVGTSSITGTLKAVTGYTGFSSNTEEQAGHYLVLHCEDEEADSITVEVVGGTKGPIALDDDGIIICRITSTDQSIKVVGSEEKTFSLSGMTLAE